MKGTEYEDNFFFYHDALTQLTDKESINYMQDKGMLKHWILPKAGLLNGTRWANSPLGNSPEFNPLDCNLNRDIHEAARLHILLITSNQKNLGINEKEYLSTTKQKDLAKMYLSVWENHPCSERIITDVTKIPKNFRTVYMSDGCVVKGIGQNDGIRYRRKIDVWNQKVKQQLQEKKKSDVKKNLIALSPMANQCLDSMVEKTKIKVEKSYQGSMNLNNEFEATLV